MTGEFSIAVHALVFLNHHQGEILSSEALAENVCTNPARIRKVMAKLKKAGLVKTKSGSEGGYYFDLDPFAVDLRSICEAIGGKVVSTSWRSGDSEMDCLIASGMADIMDEIFMSLDAVGKKELEKTTVGDIDLKIFGSLKNNRREKMKHYDAVIIGFGKGGKTLAGSLAGMGKKVAMIEKSDKMYGGTCINVGCIPTKSLVNSAKASVIQKPGSYDEKNRLYWEAVEEKRRLTGMLRKKNFDKLNDLDNVTVYNGLGSFVSANRVKIETAEETFEVEGDQIFINTGSVSVIPPIKGIEGNPYVYTSDSLMELDVLPKRLAIIGGGYIGLEYASMYTDFGAEVTVYQIEDKLIPREDRDIAEAIQKAFEDKGVRFEMNVQTEEIENAGDEAVVHYKKDGTALSASADAVLIATGRKPNTDGLNLEAAGVEKTPRGAVKVDEKLRTSAPNIWAMGDVAGGLQFTYVSLDDFRIVKDQLAGSGKRASNDRTVPYSVFIDPPFSRVGLNEEEAAAQGYHVKISKLPAAAIPKAQVLRKPVGLLKAVIDADTNKILGAMLFCEESYEMINIVKLAMDAGLDYTVLRDQIFTHPTMSEALNDLFAV